MVFAVFFCFCFCFGFSYFFWFPLRWGAEAEAEGFKMRSRTCAVNGKEQTNGKRLKREATIRERQRPALFVFILVAVDLTFD